MRIIILSLILLLSGCATQLQPHQIAPSLTWKQRQIQLKHIQTWQVSGATAIQTQQQAQSASLSWQQISRQQYVIDLFGPLGLGAVKLTGNANIVTLYANQRLYTANSPEQLLEENLGWQLPVSNLYYWIRGLPAPSLPAKMSFDSQHHLKTLTQQNWLINYISYQTVNDIDLPKKITLTNNLARVTVVISHWTITQN